MAHFAHLGTISRLLPCVLGGTHALAIAIDRIDRFSCSHNRGVATVAYVGRGLSGALESVSDTMYDVCNAFLYKKSIVPASNDTKD